MLSEKQKLQNSLEEIISVTNKVIEIPELFRCYRNTFYIIIGKLAKIDYKLSQNYKNLFKNLYER